MAYGGNDILTLGYDAAQALVRYTAVVLSDADTVDLVTAEGDVWIGVTQFDVSAAEITAGKGATVMLAGVSLMLVGTGGVSAGTLGVSDAAGLVVASNTGARPLGIVLADGVAGDWVPVRLTPGLALVP